jgi:hypothetical protein
MHGRTIVSPAPSPYVGQQTDAKLSRKGEHMKRHDRRAASWIALRLLGLAVLLGSSSLTLADPALEAQGRCAVVSPAAARALADSLYQQGAYQRAGQCYQIAGDSDRANVAFTRALGPASAVTARQASDQAEQTKVVVERYKRALHLQQ